MRAGDPRAMEKGENVVLLDYWVPDGRPNETPDERLQAEGLPKTVRLAEFCFARKKVVDDVAGLVPPALSFIFTLTSSTGERTHCFCLRAHRPDDAASHRLDVGGEWIEAAVFVSKYPFHRLFPAALNICRVRRTLDRPSHLHFLQQLHRGLPTGTTHTSPTSGQPRSITVDSPCMNVACKYEFSTSREPKLDCLFDITNPQMLHYVLGAILLERRVCLVAKHEKRLSDAAYALATLACGEAPLKGYCHNFVPVLPGTMLELGLGNPAPYMVGILRSHLKATDGIKELGDIVIVDLDSKVVKLSPGGSPIMPLGLDTSSTDQPGKKTDGNEQLNPWLDVCGPFGKDLNAAYQNRDVDALVVAVRAVILIVTVGRVGQHLEDPAMRLFNAAFRKTQIAAAASTANDSAISVMLGQRGYVALRSQLAAQQANITSAEKQVINQAKQAVLDLTAISGKGRPDLVTKSTADIAKRSFDSWVYMEGTQVAIRTRLTDCAGRSWKHAYKSLALLNLLIRAGSELVVSECWDGLGTIFELTRYSLNGTVGVPSRVVDLVQKRAVELYELIVDLHALTFARTASGHVMIQRAVRQKMQQGVARVSISKDLQSLLDFAAPSPIVEPDPEEETSRVTSTSGMARPPPPPPRAPPPPAAPEGVLLDFGSFSPPANTPQPVLSGTEDLFASAVPILSSIPQGLGKVPPPPPPPPSAFVVPSQPDTVNPPIRADTKLLTAFEPKPPPPRADTKLVSAFDNPVLAAQGAMARNRRPRTNEDVPNWGPAPSDAADTTKEAPPRPARAAPSRPQEPEGTVETSSPSSPSHIKGLEQPMPSSPTASNLGKSLSPVIEGTSIKDRYPPPGVKQKSPPKTDGAAPVARPRGPPPPGIKGPSNTQI